MAERPNTRNESLKSNQRDWQMVLFMGDLLNMNIQPSLKLNESRRARIASAAHRGVILGELLGLLNCLEPAVN